ncbi:MAG TPA: hypothetical protein VMW70_13365 [Burkholderiales bacterium]|nr:hypothetical protein [Burkholderiales bacterium]
MKILTAMILASAAVFAHAHEGGTQTPQTGYDCEHPPSDAVAQVPGLLGTAGRLVCLPTGPAIYADGAWTWRYTGSFFDLPLIPGYAHVDSASMLPPFYFTGLSVRELSAEEAVQRSESLAQEVETYRPEGALKRMEIVDAVNNYGRSIKVYVAMESDDNGWVVVCTPECQPSYVILIEKRKPN